MKRILHVVGARPNFMKIAPIVHEVNNHPQEFEQMLVHTGQHYDANMSKIFFDELDLPKPDLNLEVGSGSHAQQTAQVMQRLEPVLLDYKPDWVIVPGDVNSTLACALVASKLGHRVAHVEAGLRSFDRTMPEEINRILTDQISDLLFTPSPDADENLLREGVAPTKIRFVGNVMIDTLVQLLPKARDRWPSLQSRMRVSRYALVTLHRPFNVDNPQILGELLQALETIAEQIDVIFPVHPRTRQRIVAHELLPAQHKITLLEPLGYLDFLALQLQAAFVLTDSGGVQEETTYLGIPCLTARPNTERPVTITTGTNQLVESSYVALVTAAEKILTRPIASNGTIPELWDGSTAKRIVEVLASCHGCG